MSENVTALATWRGLFEVVARVKQLAPWDWMEETHLFGVEDPQSRQLYFVSVMGMLGEYTSIAVYLGVDSLYEFLSIEDVSPSEPDPAVIAERVLGNRHVQAIFEDRDGLTERDRDLIKQLGLKFRGRGEWPMFRSYEAGWEPWYLKPEEVAILMLALEQLLDVAPRFRGDKRLLRRKKEHFLVRVRQADGTWTDEDRHIPPPLVQPIPVARDEALQKKVSSLPKRPLNLEVDLFMLLNGIRDRGERPYYPYVLLLADSRSGAVLGQAMRFIETTRDAMWGEVPMNLMGQFLQLGAVPQAVHVQSSTMYQVLQPLLKELDIPLKLKSSLPALQEARDSLMRFMMGDLPDRY